MDRIHDIVQRALDLAEIVRRHENDRFESVLSSLLKLVEELRDSAPDHPARRRLEIYIETFRK
jgi:hypothetical protein